MRKRQGPGPTVQHIRESDAFGNAARIRVNGGISDEVDERIRKQRELDVLEDGLALQRPRMLEHDPDARARDAVRSPSRDVDALECDRTTVRAHNPHDERHHRRFPRPVRADQTEYLAAPQIEAHLLDGDEASEPLRQSADLERRRLHPRSPRCKA
jgi:hypothetical protein